MGRELIQGSLPYDNDGEDPHGQLAEPPDSFVDDVTDDIAFTAEFDLEDQITMERVNKRFSRQHILAEADDVFGNTKHIRQDLTNKMYKLVMSADININDTSEEASKKLEAFSSILKQTTNLAKEMDTQVMQRAKLVTTFNSDDNDKRRTDEGIELMKAIKNNEIERGGNATIEDQEEDDRALKAACASLANNTPINPLELSDNPMDFDGAKEVDGSMTCGIDND